MNYLIYFLMRRMHVSYRDALNFEIGEAVKLDAKYREEKMWDDIQQFSLAGGDVSKITEYKLFIDRQLAKRKPVRPEKVPEKELKLMKSIYNNLLIEKRGKKGSSNGRRRSNINRNKSHR